MSTQQGSRSAGRVGKEAALEVTHRLAAGVESPKDFSDRVKSACGGLIVSHYKAIAQTDDPTEADRWLAALLAEIQLGISSSQNARFIVLRQDKNARA